MRKIEGLEHLHERRPIIDVRAHVEFAQGSVPGSFNLPLLNDDERAVIGTTYKVDGPAAAVALGHSLISGAVKEQRLLAWTSFLHQHPDAAIMCFRGGQRSHLVQAELQKAGFEQPLIEGGFKRLRGLLLERLLHAAETLPLRVISGFTGAGKTEVMRAHHASGQVRFLDLEKAARHRGSSFGVWPEGQPAPAAFESDLGLSASLFLQSLDASENPIWIEDESRSIGKLVLPLRLFTAMAEAPMFILERPRDERARRLTFEYLSENYGFKDGIAPSETKALQCELDIRRAVTNIERRLGGQETKTILAMADEAGRAFRQDGSFSNHWAWVERLLEKYYDPSYENHLGRITDRVVGRGPVEEFNSLVLR